MPEDIRIKARPVGQGEYAHAVVDIIVPFHGQYEKVTRLVKSLYRGTSSNPFRLILVDDGSPNATFAEHLGRDRDRERIDNLVIVRNDRHEGFGSALWTGFLKVEYPYVCFLNSDCVIEDVDWLRALFETYARQRAGGVKFVSSRMDNPTSGDPRVRGTRATKTRDVVLDPKSIDQIVGHDTFVPLTATLCHRDLFDRIGGFVKPYPVGMYEDLELACRLFAHGYRQAISGASYVHHDGGATFASLAASPDAREQIGENFARCCRDIKSLKKPVRTD